MNYLSEKHKTLSESQQSGLMKWFGQLPMDKKAVAIGLSLTVGISSAAMAWQGTSSDRIYFCIKTPLKTLTCSDKNGRPFRMTPFYWSQWKSDGMPRQVVRDPAMGVNGLVKATNPYKPFWGFGGFLGFALAGWMLRHCQSEEKQRAVFEDIAQKRDAAKAEMAARSELLESYRDVAIAEVQLQADLDLIANDRTVDIQKAEIYAHTEIEVTQMEATDALFEAQTAGMTEEQKADYIKQLREMKTPYLQGSQTLQGTIDPNDKVTGADNQAIASQDNKTAWVQNLVKQTALIWGNQGGGKSWLARYVIQLKKRAGYRVIVLDPDSNRSEWRGVESYHSWDEIEQQIRNYLKELESRLKTFNDSSMSEEQWRQKLWASGKALSLICEEATTYGDFIKDAELLEKFGKLALTKSRKQEMPLTVVAHNNTQTCLFGIKGLHNLVSKMLQVECLAEVDSVTLQPSSTGKAKVKLDSSNEWLDVNLPKMTAKISDFSDALPAESNPNPPIDKATLERIYELELNLGNKGDNTQIDQNKLSLMAQKLYEYLTRTERIEADVREFKGNFKVQGERFTVEQIKGWMYEIVGAGLADWIAEGVIKLNQI
ncbi:ATP-binding protein [Nostoc sp. UCD121]|uniref:ATP-binding protein n=1 Tax=unclassified Nostoc TaxID=2593658 RepID=UPI0016295413|nr:MULTISPECIES: ATP-binding protein [unclassified Nostoc]MBC1220711.1 ATP-binding protein [Nostoc sp. UCD120]MBC1280910.1 ATP-binding protein [Nostoc sp. UCD121]